MAIPKDFSHLDRNLLTELGVDTVAYEIEHSHDDPDRIEKMYASLPNDWTRFVMAWVFDMRRTQTSCAKASGRSLERVKYAIRRIRKKSKSIRKWLVN